MDDITRRRARCKTPRNEAGVSYFVTYPLADALPRAVLEAWHEETEHRMRMFAQVRRRLLTPEEETEIAEKTRGHVETYLDRGHGACILADPRLANLVEQTLQRFAGERYELHAWCVMPNHFHCVLTPLHGSEMVAILKAWAWYSAHEVNRLLKRTGALWQPMPYFQPLKTTEARERMVLYVLDNPAKAGLLEWPHVGGADPAPVSAEYRAVLR